MQSSRAFGFYLDELRLLGAELSLDLRLVQVSEALRELADRSSDRSPYRSDEPYRRALIGMYARLAATARVLGATNILRKEVGPAAPYGNAAEFGADLQLLIDSLGAHHGGLLVKPRLSTLKLGGAARDVIQKAGAAVAASVVAEPGPWSATGRAW